MKCCAKRAFRICVTYWLTRLRGFDEIVKDDFAALPQILQQRR
jgi:hypothetical protein